MDDDLFFPSSTGREISKQEYEELRSPDAQQTELLENLKAWADTAAAVLREHGHYVTDLVDDPTPSHKFSWLFCYKVDAIQAPAARDAYELLVAINDLWKCLFQDDKALIANAGIRVGLAMAKAHVRDFESVARRGKENIENLENGWRKRSEQCEPERKDWLKTAYDIWRARKRKPKKRELAQLVEAKLHPNLSENERKKRADHHRHWFLTGPLTINSWERLLDRPNLDKP